MKTKIVGILAFFMLFVGISQYTKAGDKKDFIGEWNYKVLEAPYGQNTGVLLIKMDSGKIEAKSILSDQTELNAGNIKYKDGHLIFTIQYEYDTITADLFLEGDTLKGRINTPSGLMNMLATKKVE